MYLTAQRVRDSFNREGINAFRYAHGYTWQLPPPGVLDQDSGVLVYEIVTIQPAGNAVRSYLDIIAPDDAFWPEIRPAFTAFVGSAQRQPFPWDGGFGRCYFYIGMDHFIAHTWRTEIANLYRALLAVYPVPTL
jgi:hypothetical protein